jgi:hypothetical protein
MVADPITVTTAEPDLLVFKVEVAVIVAVPAAVGVKTPALLTVPILDGLTDHVTVVLKFPVPVTVGAQVEVCVVKMDVGEQATTTEVIVTGIDVIVTLAEPDLVESCVDVALTEANPETGAAAGAVYNPELEIVPESVDQATAEL